MSAVQKGNILSMDNKNNPGIRYHIRTENKNNRSNGIRSHTSTRPSFRVHIANKTAFLLENTVSAILP